MLSGACAACSSHLESVACQFPALYLASPSWSNLLAIADAPPMLVVACAPPLRFIAYVSLAFSLRHFCFFRTCGERPRRIRPLGGKTTLCFICADPCRTRFLSPLWAVGRFLRRRVDRRAPPPWAVICASCVCASPRRPSLVAYANALPSGGRVLSAPPKRALSAQLKQALVRRHSVGVRECAAEVCACTLPL